MKLKEKLSKEATPSNTFGHCSCEEDFQTGFITGFEKAREMAIDEAIRMVSSRGALIDKLEVLGEEEAK